MSLQTINRCTYCWAGLCTNQSLERPSSASEVGGFRYCDDLGQGTATRITCDKAKVEVVTVKPILKETQSSRLQRGLSEVHDGDGII